jgi:AbrB family looped-hinge helix DNA binding protein
MSVLSKLTSKGQTTIPRKVRDKLALQPGDLIAFEI